ncbi:hypothetical protein [Streptomyces sp. NPDC005805]|uniref:hypothetical protein n=1 Tax=Streptomyces sp. NPDC005805 TaxID=3157068 RepID=UPI0033EF84EB
MSVARRPLLTATAAGSLLCALWFVPSANASGESRQGQAHAAAGTVTSARNAVAPEAGPGSDGKSQDQSHDQDQDLRLADTGGVNTTPYVIAGSAFLAIGAGFVAYSVRRGGGAYPA